MSDDYQPHEDDTRVHRLEKRMTVVEGDVSEVKGDVIILKQGQADLRSMAEANHNTATKTYGLVEKVLIEIRGDPDGGGNVGLWPTMRESRQRIRTLEEAKISNAAKSDTWGKATSIFLKYILPVIGSLATGAGITYTVTQGGTP